MNFDDKPAMTHPDYAKLPECIKSVWSEKDYASLPDEERLHLEETESLPDYEED